MALDIEDPIEMVKEAARAAEEATTDGTQVYIMVTSTGMMVRGTRKAGEGSVSHDDQVSFAQLQAANTNVLKLAVERVVSALDAALR